MNAFPNRKPTTPGGSVQKAADGLAFARARFDAEADRLFRSPLTLAQAWAALRAFAARQPAPLPTTEITGWAALAAWAAGRSA